MEMDPAYVFQWYILLPNILGHGILPAVIAICFCRCRKVPAEWLPCSIYVVLSACLAFLEYRLGLKGGAGLILETVLLACWGKLFAKHSGVPEPDYGGRKQGMEKETYDQWSEMIALSALLLSILSVTNGLISWFSHRIFSSFITRHENLIYPSDSMRELVKVLVVLILYQIIMKQFSGIMDHGDRKAFLWMTVPAFFISLVERIIQHSVYGDCMMVDNVSGEFISIIDINHGEMLFLQIFACVCLFLVLIAYEKITMIFQENQKLKLLDQQASAQEIYIREAAIRDQQTRAFRHDIRNHLTVVGELLKNSQIDEACRYLSQLDQASHQLSDRITTGNSAVDALLQSKLSIADQHQIRTECQLKIPQTSVIQNLDWCIILSNGIDNAIQACLDLEPEKRYMKLESRKKGNFYLITIENSCSHQIRQLPEDGIGLSNIRAVAKKYNGRAENTVSDGVYRLKLLFIDSHQKNAL